jgi:hypothetical protein
VIEARRSPPAGLNRTLQAVVVYLVTDPAGPDVFDAPVLRLVLKSDFSAAKNAVDKVSELSSEISNLHPSRHCITARLLPSAQSREALPKSSLEVGVPERGSRCHDRMLSPQ